MQEQVIQDEVLQQVDRERLIELACNVPTLLVSQVKKRESLKVFSIHSPPKTGF
jgi:hypothetical protein